jgi:hypothetical protein
MRCERLDTIAAEGEAEAMQLALPLACEAPRASKGQRSIEADFPILEVRRLAQLESHRKNIYRPAYYIHKWWSGRLGSVFHTLILATLAEDDIHPVGMWRRLYRL